MKFLPHVLGFLTTLLCIAIFVPEDNALYYVAFVDRDEIRKAISLRYAERKEINHYAKSYR